VASLWSGGIDRLTPTHPLGNNDEFQGVSPLFHRPELVSARPAPGSAIQCTSLKNLRSVALGKNAATIDHVTALRMLPPNTRNTRKEICVISGDSPRPTNPTGGNRENRGSSPSPFSPLPPVQKPQRRSLMPNAEVSDRRGQGRWSARGTLELPPGIERRSRAAVRSTDFVRLLMPVAHIHCRKVNEVIEMAAALLDGEDCPDASASAHRLDAHRISSPVSDFLRVHRKR